VSAGEFRLVGWREVASAAFLTLVREHYVDPNGGALQRVAVRHPGAVAVAPILGGALLLFRQFRSPIGRSLLEIPAGKRDVPDEPPDVTAARELEEEIGYRPGRLELIGEFWTTPGFTDEHMTLYLATELEPVEANAHGVEEEFAELVSVDLGDLQGMIDRGEFEDAKTLIAVQHVIARL
jgi:ADP-ribose diphosphatase